MGALEAPAPVDEGTSKDWAEVYRRAWSVVRRIGDQIADPGFDLEDMTQAAVIGAWLVLSATPTADSLHALNRMRRLGHHVA